MGMMINRRRVMGGKLPYDAEIEYLESSQRAFIKIPYFANTNTVVDTVFYNVTDTPYALGTRTSKNAGNYFAIGVGIPKGKIALFFGNHSNSVAAAYTEQDVVHIVAGNGELNVNGLITTYSNLNFASTNPFDIFCAATDSSGDAIGNLFAPFPIGRTVIKEYGLVLYDLIPVRVGTTGYMYDKVSKQLFGNAGTGAFILGPDK